MMITLNAPGKHFKDKDYLPEINNRFQLFDVQQRQI